MNRREFTKSLVAASVTPALPLSALASGAPAVAAAKDPMYFWANFISRVHNKSSPGMLSRLLKLDPDHASRLYTQLVSDGALTAPDAFGLSVSTNPLHPEFSRVAGHGKGAIETLKKQNKNNILEDDTRPAEDANVDEPPTECEETLEAERPEDAPLDTSDEVPENTEELPEDHPDFTSS